MADAQAPHSCDPWPLNGDRDQVGDVVPCRWCGRDWVIAAMTRKPAGRYGQTLAYRFTTEAAVAPPPPPRAPRKVKECDHSLDRVEPPQLARPAKCLDCGRLVPRAIGEAARAFQLKRHEAAAGAIATGAEGRSLADLAEAEARTTMTPADSFLALDDCVACSLKAGRPVRHPGGGHGQA